MASKYNDSTAVIQVIGCVFNNPTLLEVSDKYNINDEDFVNEFHRIVFGAIYKLWENGAKTITLANIADFLSVRPKSEAIYQTNKGEEWLAKVSQNAMPSTFDYYYNRLKKFSLLRAYDKYGVDVSDIYDPDNLLDAKKKQAQEEFLDNTPLSKIADKIDEKIDDIRMKYVEQVDSEAIQAGDGALELIEKLKKHPEVGVPLYGPLINTVTRGARLSKFYLRSGATGAGKSRTMIADACYIGCSKIYDENFGWINTGVAQPSLYVTTEQDLSEIQTMMIAFLSNVNEEHILNGTYEDDEEERVMQAIEILKESSLYVEILPDFSLQDVENVIKKNVRERGILYVFRQKA